MFKRWRGFNLTCALRRLAGEVRLAGELGGVALIVGGVAMLTIRPTLVAGVSLIIMANYAGGAAGATATTTGVFIGEAERNDNDDR